MINIGRIVGGRRAKKGGNGSNVGVMYSGEYDACDVTLSVYPHWASLKNMPDRALG
jgi:hypothetical protein